MSVLYGIGWDQVVYLAKFSFGMGLGLLLVFIWIYGLCVDPYKQ